MCKKEDVFDVIQKERKWAEWVKKKYEWKISTNLKFCTGTAAAPWIGGGTLYGNIFAAATGFSNSIFSYFATVWRWFVFCFRVSDFVMIFSVVLLLGGCVQQTSFAYFSMFCYMYKYWLSEFPHYSMLFLFWIPHYLQFSNSLPKYTRKRSLGTI